uniref:Uncharacterized protein n=1 Tax=Pinctada fucata TaxID=50426 RepID=A0A194AMC2_PINFU
MRTCPRTCSKMLLIAQLRLWRSTTLRRTLLPLSRRNSTKSTTQPGTALLDATLGAMSHMKPSISSTSILDRLPFFCSNLVEAWTVQQVVEDI